MLEGGWPQFPDVKSAIESKRATYEPSRTFFNFTYEVDGVVALASDEHTPYVAAIYEPNCIGCNAELTGLVRVSQTFAGGKYRVFLVSSSPAEAVRRSIAGVPGTSSFQIVSDFQSSLFAAMHVEILPMQYFVDGNGQVQLIHAGSFGNGEADVLRSILRA